MVLTGCCVCFWHFSRCGGSKCKSWKAWVLNLRFVGLSYIKTINPSLHSYIYIYTWLKINYHNRFRIICLAWFRLLFSLAFHERFPLVLLSALQCFPRSVRGCMVHVRLRLFCFSILQLFSDQRVKGQHQTWFSSTLASRMLYAYFLCVI